MKRHVCSLLSFAAVCLLVGMLAFAVTAASNSTTITDGTNTVKITDTESKITKNSDGTVTILAKNNNNNVTTNNITFTNASSNKVRLSFDYSLSGHSATNLPSATGSYSVVLEENATSDIITITSKYNKWNDKSDATLLLSNITVKTVVDSASVSVISPSDHTVKANGTAIDPETTLNVGISGVSLVADSTNFVAWINKADNSILSMSNSFTFLPTSATAQIEALYGPNACFQVGNYMYSTLNDAVSKAQNSANKVIVLANTGELPKGDYSIPTDVTLLIPYDSAYTVSDKTPNHVESAETQEAFRTLEVASGASITINGTLEVGGRCLTGTSSNSYRPTGAYGLIKLSDTSHIDVTGNLYAWGYIIGDGTITAKSGATVYEFIQITDWRGGNATKNMVPNALNLNPENIKSGYYVFPFSQYYVQNIEAAIKFESGAAEHVFLCTAVKNSLTSNLVTSNIDAVFIGAGGLLQIGNDGSVTKKYDKTNERLAFTIDGTVAVNKLQIELKVYVSVDIDSSDYNFPLTNNLTFNLEPGCNLTVGQDVAVLPGVEINIADGATLEVAAGANVYVYDSAEWKADYLWGNSGKVRVPVLYVASTGKAGSKTTVEDAKINVNGTLNVLGNLYTTASGANICSDGTGKVIFANAASSGSTYQYIQSSETYDPIDIKPAYLKNGDGTYVHSGSDTYTYDPVAKAWRCGTHKDEDSNCICDVCKYVMKFDIEYANLTLKSVMSMNFAFKQSHVANWTGCHVVIVKSYADGRPNVTQTLKFDEQEWSATTIDGEAYYYASFTGIAAKEMCDQVTATVYNASGIAISNVKIDSVKDYAHRTLNNTSSTEKTKTLMVDMLNYGAAAQTAFTYAQDNLANAGLTDEQVKFATVSMKDCTDRRVKEDNYKGSSLLLKENIQLLLAFSNLDESMTAKISYTNHNGTPVEVTAKTVAGEKYGANGLRVVLIDGFAIADARGLITVEVYNGETLVASASDSIESYVAREIEAARNADLCTKIMMFADATYAFNH